MHLSHEWHWRSCTAAPFVPAPHCHCRRPSAVCCQCRLRPCSALSLSLLEPLSCMLSLLKPLSSTLSMPTRNTPAEADEPRWPPEDRDSWLWLRQSNLYGSARPTTSRWAPVPSNPPQCLQSVAASCSSSIPAVAAATAARPISDTPHRASCSSFCTHRYVHHTYKYFANMGHQPPSEDMIRMHYRQMVSRLF